jgi:hypothetical protein
MAMAASASDQPPRRNSRSVTVGIDRLEGRALSFGVDRALAAAGNGEYRADETLALSALHAPAHHVSHLRYACVLMGDTPICSSASLGLAAAAAASEAATAAPPPPQPQQPPPQQQTPPPQQQRDGNSRRAR